MPILALCGTWDGPAGPTGAGATGPAGPTGPTGIGIPTGGATGEVLTKNSTTNYDASWQVAAGGINIVREQIDSTLLREINILAASPNLTSGITITRGSFSGDPQISFIIPAGVKLISAMLRLNFAAGDYSAFGSMYLDTGTTDMPNAGFANRWGASHYAWREDNGANLAVNVTIDMPTASPTKLKVNSLSTAAGSCLLKIDF